MEAKKDRQKIKERVQRFRKKSVDVKLQNHKEYLGKSVMQKHDSISEAQVRMRLMSQSKKSRLRLSFR